MIPRVKKRCNRLSQKVLAEKVQWRTCHFRHQSRSSEIKKTKTTTISSESKRTTRFMQASRKGEGCQRKVVKGTFSWRLIHQWMNLTALKTMITTLFSRFQKWLTVDRLRTVAQVLHSNKLPTSKISTKILLKLKTLLRITSWSNWHRKNVIDQWLE